MLFEPWMTFTIFTDTLVEETASVLKKHLLGAVSVALKSLHFGEWTGGRNLLKAQLRTLKTQRSLLCREGVIFRGCKHQPSIMEFWERLP